MESICLYADELGHIPVDAENVRFMFRPSLEDMVHVMRTCPDLKTIYLTANYSKTTARSLQKMCDIRGITVSVTRLRSKARKS